MTETMYAELMESPSPWYCMRCLAIKSNKIKWGDMEGEEAIKTCITSAYNEIIKWRKNIFILPRGNAGTEFLKEQTRLLNEMTNDTKWSRVALTLQFIFVFFIILCQKLKFELKS